MSEPTCAELDALLAQLVQSTERARTALDATLRSFEESEAGRPEREAVARARALAEFEDVDFARLFDALRLVDNVGDDSSEGSDRR